jgi:hypothetical protein
VIEVVAVEAQHADGASWSTLPLLVSGMMTAGSVGVMSPHLLLVYPVYFALINAVLTAAIGHRRAAGSRRKAQGARGLALAR